MIQQIFHAGGFIINISVKDVLYINDWRGCLLLSLSFYRVC